jgi:hypothetical protein
MQQRFVCVFSTLWPLDLVTTLKLLRRSQDASGSTMSDTPRPPPPLPQHALIWIVVAALVLVLVRAAWRGWL